MVLGTNFLRAWYTVYTVADNNPRVLHFFACNANARALKEKWLVLGIKRLEIQDDNTLSSGTMKPNTFKDGVHLQNSCSSIMSYEYLGNGSDDEAENS